MAKFNSFKILSFLLAIVLVIFFTLFLGQVLGKFYLANIQGGEVQEELVKRSLPSRGSSNAGELNKKKKVLRLKKVEYYTILVATVDRQEEALRIGRELGKKGLPAVVTRGDSYRILLGLLNNREKLIPLAERIKVGEVRAEIISESLNKLAFKFEASDTFAAGKIAPFLGKVSLCLEKGLLLYKNITIADEEIASLRPKYALLADSLEEAANEGAQIAQEIKTGTGDDLKTLSRLCKEWAQVLRLLDQEWTDLTLLKGQQQGSALLEEYHRFIAKTN